MQIPVPVNAVFSGVALKPSCPPSCVVLHGLLLSSRLSPVRAEREKHIGLDGTGAFWERFYVTAGRVLWD